MFSIGLFLVRHQTILTLSTFIVGFVILFVVARKANSKTWKKIDLVWVIFGGTAALSAVIASLYISQDDALSRKVDVLKATMTSLTNEAARFNYRFCANPNPIEFYSTMVGVACSSNRKMISSISASDSLPILSTFADTTESVPLIFDKTVLSALLLEDGRNIYGDDMIIDKFHENRFFFDASPLVDPKIIGKTFLDPYNSEVLASLEALNRSGLYGELIADYKSLADTYKNISFQLLELNESWEENRQNYYFLALRVISILLLAFVFPLRLGKSWYDLKHQ